MLDKLVKKAEEHARRRTAMMQSESEAETESEVEEGVINVLDIDFETGDDSGDDGNNEDWMANNYLSSVASKPSHPSGSGNNEKELTSSESDTEMDRDDSDSETDGDGFDDEMSTVVMSSVEEDRMMDAFESWLMGIDGGDKNERTARNHRLVAQRMLRDNPSKEIMPWASLLDRSYLRTYIDFSR